jgi:hypothetical protein
MRPSLLVVLLVLALAAGLAEPSRSAQQPRVKLLLNSNDSVLIAGTRIACRVVRASKKVTNRLVCFERAKRGLKPAVKSYVVSLAARGVTVERWGAKSPVFDRSESIPDGPPPGSATAPAAMARVLSLGDPKDQIYVATTNIVCRPYGQPRTKGVLCVLMGKDGHIPDASYLVLLTDSMVAVAQAQHGKAVKVFQRTHGH